MDSRPNHASSRSAYIFVSINLLMLLAFLLMSSNSLRMVDETRRLYEELFRDWYLLRLSMVDPPDANASVEYARFETLFHRILESESLRANAQLSAGLRDVSEDLRDGWRLAAPVIRERLRAPLRPFHESERRIVSSVETGLIALQGEVDLMIQGQQRALEMLLYVLGATVAATIGIFWLVERESVVQRSNAHLVQTLAHSTIGAQEAERKRITSALHDSLAQEIGLCLLQLGSGTEPLPADRVSQVRDSLVRSIDWLRTLAYELHPAEIDQVGLAEALRGYCRGLSDRGAARITYRVERVDPLPGQHAINVYRVGQEAIANAIRHAGDATISIDFYDNGDSVVLRVEDDGVGFSAGHGTGRAVNAGLGLVGMHERARIVNGTLAVRSEPGMGTVVELRVPRVKRPIDRRRSR